MTGIVEDDDTILRVFSPTSRTRYRDAPSKSDRRHNEKSDEVLLTTTTRNTTTVLRKTLLQVIHKILLMFAPLSCSFTDVCRHITDVPVKNTTS